VKFTAGTKIIITGMSLKQTTGVKIGAVKVTAFAVVSDTRVTATIPAGAITGKVSVTTAGGAATGPRDVYGAVARLDRRGLVTRRAARRVLHF
jgi:IPT/TIG domain-containing protein